jgi:hypothetical protein
VRFVLTFGILWSRRYRRGAQGRWRHNDSRKSGLTEIQAVASK